MEELEYVLSRFDSHFGRFRGKRIALHGTREYARGILERFDVTYHFSGVMTADGQGEFCGKPVLNEDALAQGGIDLLILTERVKYAEEVYRRLQAVCRAQHIGLYNMYGVDEMETHRAYEAGEYMTMTRWKARCAPFDVIAFEAMDAMLTQADGQLRARPLLARLAAWAGEQGKTVLYSLRKSFPEAEQIDALAEQGLFENREAAERAVVRRQGEDLSFRRLCEAFPGRKILYICHHEPRVPVNEFILPRCYGMETACYVPYGFQLERLMPRWQDADRDGAGLPEGEALLRRLREEIAACEVVSFDVFDTLLTRAVLAPEDVFERVVRRAGGEGLDAADYVRLRTEAQRRLSGTLEAFYAWMAREGGWPAQAAERLMAIELDEERALIRPRRAVAALVGECVAAGKRVVLVSDMYLPRETLSALLAENGITGYERLFVSCSEGKLKGQGLFDTVQEALGTRSIVHIGDDPVSDGMAAEAAGLSSVLIPSVAALARAHGWARAIGAARTPMERGLLATVLQALFDDPFRNAESVAMSEAERLRRYGYGAAGPMLAGYLTWLAAETAGRDFAAVLFFARDGWLPVRLWERLAGAHPELSLPRGVYFYANRRAAFLGCASERFQEFSFDEQGRMNGLTPPEVLERYFDLPAAEIAPWRPGEETPTAYLARHAEAIRARERATRAGYTRVLAKNGLRPGDACAVSDFVSVGRTQRFLSSYLPLRLAGYYVGEPDYSPERNEARIDFYCRGENPAFLQNFLEMDGFMTAPMPSQARMNEHGEPEFASEVRPAETLRRIEAVQEAMERLTLDFLRLHYRAGEVVSPRLAEEIYAAEGDHGVMTGAYDDWGMFDLMKAITDSRKAAEPAGTEDQ